MTETAGLTRREFLRRSGAAAVAMPFIVPASALGKDGHVAPSNRINMGFIGLGGQGTGHLLGGAWTYITGGYVGRDDVQVLAVCDVWRGRRENARQRVDEFYAGRFGQGDYHACQGYLDFREILARDDIDAVLIGTPIHWHATMSALAAEAGKDVYCEKPTALSLEESRRMADAVKRYGRVYQAGTQQRSEYGGKFHLACELIRSGRIGRLKEVWAHIPGGNFVWNNVPPPGMPVPEDLDWDLWLGPAPKIPYDGAPHAHRFGNDPMNWGQHHYDIVQWSLDADRTGPVELSIEDGKTTYRYANGVVVYGAAYPNQPVGDTGGGTWVGTEGTISVDREELVSTPPSLVKEPLGPDDVHLYPSHSHTGNFLECVKSRKPTICDAETAHRAASVMLLGGVVQQLGRTLHWDPVTEQFDDDEANRLRSVAWRAPWGI
jgi:predicted dehydrogenase